MTQPPEAGPRWADRGSRLQVQLYVNRRAHELTDAVLRQTPSLAEVARTLAWTAPLERDGFSEPQDRGFLRAVGYEDFAPQLAEFWPTRGPVWDALAVAILPAGRPGVVLVEAKSHPAEVYGGGTQASAGSRARIADALTATRLWLGLSEDPTGWLDALRPDEPGHSSVYQAANRLAHLYWLRERMSVEAWLVNLLFVDDPTHRSTSLAAWEASLPAIEEDLGLPAGAVPYASHAFVAALTPSLVK
jgi:hypothetical protein